MKKKAARKPKASRKAARKSRPKRRRPIMRHSREG